MRFLQILCDLSGGIILVLGKAADSDIAATAFMQIARYMMMVTMIVMMMLMLMTLCHIQCILYIYQVNMSLKRELFCGGLNIMIYNFCK